MTGFSGEVAAKSCDLTGSNLIIKGGVMALQKGESYRCPDPDSGCEKRHAAPDHARRSRAKGDEDFAVSGGNVDENPARARLSGHR